VSGNPNWPLLRGELCATGNQYYNSATSYTDLTKRLTNQWGFSRGKQYELDESEPGKGNLMWRNEDGALDPTNTGSVYNGMLLPYRGYRLRMQTPLVPGTAPVNLLTGDQATAGQATPFAAGAIPAAMSVTASLATPVLATSATAYTGTQVYQTSVGASAASGGTALAITGNTIQATVAGAFLPAVTYAWSIYIRSATSGANPPMAAEVIWKTGAGVIVGTTVGTAQTLTGSATAPWTRVTVAGPPPAGAMYADIAVTLTAAGPSSAWTFQAGGAQLETAAAASAFTQPGTWWPLFSPMIERYPQTWTHHGNLGQVAPIAVDSLALLSNVLLQDPLTAAIFQPGGGVGPTFAYLLGDPSGSSSFTDQVGARSPAIVQPSKFGSGTITPGTTQTSASPTGGFAGAPDATVTNITSTTAAGTNSYGQPMSWIAVPPSAAGIAGPGTGSGLGFTRMIAFRCTALPSSLSVLWEAQSNINGTDVVAFTIYPSANLTVQLNDANHTGGTANIGVVDVGNWHLAWMAISPSGTTFTAGMDGTTATYSSGTAYAFTGGFSVDQIGCSPAINDPLNGLFNFAGDIAFACEWPYVLTTAQFQAIYTSWKTAYSGQSSGQRYAQILQWAGYTGPVAIDTGNSLSLGPATDVAGIDAFSALEQVVQTENGQHFVAAGGAITFLARARRYLNTTTAAVDATFGEQTGNGEWAYEDFATDFDTSHLANDVTITQVSTNQQVTAINTASQLEYGSQTLTQSNQSTFLSEIQDQATYLVSRYKDPHQRIAKLSIHPSAMAAAYPLVWAMVCALELGNRVQGNRRPPAPAAEDSTPGFIEQIAWTVKGSDVQIALQVSPADLNPYGVFTSMHTTLHTAVGSPTSTIVLNALSDSALNPAAAQLYAGLVLVLDYGLPTAETVTIASGGVSATVAGYSTVTLTLTANTAHTHTAGAMVSEVMPVGASSPSIYDSSAVFDTSLFAY
jgi:hypothetical protein